MSKITKIFTFIKSNDWRREALSSPVLAKLNLSKAMDCGWGNGYCALPPAHPCYGMGYDDLYREYEGKDWPAELTFARKNDGFSDECPDDYWVVGFDTMHYDDTLARWPKKKVQEAADKLAFIFLEIWIKRERNGE